MDFEGTFDTNFEPDTATETSERTLAGIVSVLEAMMNFKISWDASLCDTLIDECLKMDDVDGVKFMLYVMSESGIEIKTNTLNMLLERYSVNGDAESAFQVIETMKKYGEKTYPNKKSWNLLLEAGNKSRKGRYYSQTVIKSLRDEDSMDKEFYDRLVEFAILTDKEPDSVFESMIAAECAPDQNTIVLMLKAFFRKGDIDSAMKWYRRLRRADNARQAILMQQLKERVTGNLEPASFGKVTIDMQLPPPTKCIVMLLLKVLSTEGRYKEALSILADVNDGCRIASFQSTEEAVVLDENDVIESSSNKVKIVSTDGKKVVIVKALSSQAEKDTKKVISKTAEEAFFCSHYGPNVEAYVLVIEACIKAGKPHEGFQVFTEMERIGIAPDRRIYSLLIRLFGDLGDVSSALGVFDEMRSNFATDINSLQSIIDVCMRDPLDLRQAALLLEKMSEAGVDLDVYSGDILMQTYPDANSLSRTLMVMHNQPIHPDMQLAKVSLCVVSCLVKAFLQANFRLDRGDSSRGMPGMVDYSSVSASNRIPTSPRYSTIVEAVEFLGKVGIRLDEETLEYFTIPDIPRDDSPLSKHYYELLLPHKDKVRSVLNIEVPAVYKESTSRYDENNGEQVYNIPEPVFEFGIDSYGVFSKLFVKHLEDTTDLKTDNPADIQRVIPNKYLQLAICDDPAAKSIKSNGVISVKSTTTNVENGKTQETKAKNRRAKGGRKSLSEIVNSDDSTGGKLLPMRQKGSIRNQQQKQKRSDSSRVLK